MTENIKRIIKVVLFTLVASGIGYIGYVFFPFDLLAIKNDRLRTVKIYGKPYTLIFYRINGNATVQGGIQVRRTEGGEERLLKHYDRYNSITFITVNKNVLKMGLKEDGVKSKGIDTLFLKLP